MIGDSLYPTDFYRLLKRKIVTYNDIANLFFVISNNIAYNKLEVENILFLKKFKNIFKKKEGFFSPISNYK